jgi:peptidoglycan hydrolase-like protein with peptidoglycan-binding domain
VACTLALLTVVPTAAASRWNVSAQATPTSGPAPLHVTFTATGDATSYHWDFGDGAAADGSTADHMYAAGRWTATLTARSADGQTTIQPFAIAAYGMTLTGRSPVRYGRRSLFKGAVIPAERGLPVALVGPSGKIAHARTLPNGNYVLRARIRLPGAYVVTSERGSSQPLTLRVVPKLVARLVGSGARGGRLWFIARVVPANAGVLTVKISRGSEVLVDRRFGSRVRVQLDTRRLTSYRIRAEVVPNEGYASIARLVRATVILPRLIMGSRSPAVAQLGARLRELRFAAPSTVVFDGRMLDAVYAFEKVHGLPRTGVVDSAFWHALGTAGTPLPRFAQPAGHLEVNKGRQVLYVVRGSRVALIVPISTAGVPGTYTPVGRFAIYRKVAGFDPSPLGTLYDPMYFTAGYAIHGNPTVPPWPASHGCVRVPMWIAPYLYTTNPYGEMVYVY